MNEQAKNKTSKFLSLVLRHEPDLIGLSLDAQGWAEVGELIQKAGAKGRSFSFEELEEIVASNDKQRFAFNEDKTRIRANQGHSIEVELALAEKAPPELLYHGTVDRFLDAIGKEGLQKMSRHHVHLSVDRETAERVGSRRGKPVILVVKAGEMARQGHVFFLSENGVWLTELVPVEYIQF